MSETVWSIFAIATVLVIEIAKNAMILVMCIMAGGVSKRGRLGGLKSQPGKDCRKNKAS